ncbi:MAG TPA: DUF4349 domain-containing protein [Clostridia bacterium]|nr:DUF4349 domain-containing protein [Clostridia bacterium]
MGCKKIRYELSLYIDRRLVGRDLNKVEAHLNRCPDCREYYEDVMKIKNSCKELGTVEVPPGFHSRLSEKLYKKGENEMLGRKHRVPIFIGLASVLVVIAIGITMVNTLGLGWMKSQSPAYDLAQSQSNRQPEAPQADGYVESEEDYMEMPSMEQGEMDQKSDVGWGSDDSDISYDMGKEHISNAQRMIIKAAYLGIETLEFDVFTRNLEGKVKLMGGYIESSNIQGISKETMGSFRPRQANYEIRIPNKKFEQFNNEVGELGNLITKEISGEDVTGQYLDTQARVKSLTIQEERLLSILERAEILQDIIELESELSRVRYEIENYTGTLKGLEKMVNFSRVNVDVYEVKEIKPTEPEPETLGERIAHAFKDSLKGMGRFLENMTIFLAGALPFFVLLIPLGWIIWLLGAWLKSRRIRKGRSDRDG